MRTTSPLVAWSLLFLATLAWVGVAFFFFFVNDAAANAVESAGAAESASQGASAAAHLHALAKNSAASRTQLEQALQNDPVALASTIAQAGRDAGVALHVSNAASEGAPEGGKSITLSAIGFTVDADGSFQSLMRAIELLESLPLPSSIEALDVSQVSATSAASWHMSVRLQVFTSLPISS